MFHFFRMPVTFQLGWFCIFFKIIYKKCIIIEFSTESIVEINDHLFVLCVTKLDIKAVKI